jgi:hypothetical protein
MPLFPKLVAARAYTPRFAEYGPSLCVTTLLYGSRPRRSRASTLGTTWQSATVWRGPGTEHRDRDPSCKGGPPGSGLPLGWLRSAGLLPGPGVAVLGSPGCRSPSLFDNECGLRDPSLSRSTSPERREWASAHAEECQNLSASSPPSRREHVSDDRSPCPGRSPAMSAESVTKISSSDSRDPLAPVRAGELDDWRGRPTKSSGRMPSQLAECQRTGCNGPTIVEAERDSLRSQQPAAGTRRSDLTSPSCN